QHWAEGAGGHPGHPSPHVRRRRRPRRPRPAARPRRRTRGRGGAVRGHLPVLLHPPPRGDHHLAGRGAPLNDTPSIGRDFSRLHVENFHNAALVGGFESELIVYDTGWDVNVRRPGERTPIFYTD